MNDTPKVQWSLFSPNQKEQVVIRTDTWDEMVTLRAKALALIPQEHAFPDDIGTIATPKAKTQEGLGVCEKCGSPMKLSLKSGKPYCSALCWKK